MKEIGGYFQLDQLINKPYYKNMIGLNTGRNALIYLVRVKKIRKVYIPYFLCNSIKGILDRHSVDYGYYHVDKNFLPIFNQKLGMGEYLYVVNYYGQIGDDMITTFKRRFNHIIIDNTHAFFQKPIDGIDTIYSCRKFFGVPDGAYLSTDTILEEEIEDDSSSNRMIHILGRFEGQASDYYKQFRENDESFKRLSLKKMSKLTKNILGAIDYGEVKKIRDENYACLDSQLKALNKLKLITPTGAFAYPFYSENGIEIRKKLAGKKIYIPTLWPNVLEDMSKDSIEYDYVADILPLPCDQRYGKNDMKYMLEEIYKCIN